MFLRVREYRRSLQELQGCRNSDVIHLIIFGSRHGQRPQLSSLDKIHGRRERTHRHINLASDQCDRRVPARSGRHVIRRLEVNDVKNSFYKHMRANAEAGNAEIQVPVFMASIASSKV